MRGTIRPAALAMLALLLGGLVAPCVHAGTATQDGLALGAPDGGPGDHPDCHCVCHAISVLPEAAPVRVAEPAASVAAAAETVRVVPHDARRDKPPRLS